MAKFKIGDWFWYLEEKRARRVQVTVVLTEERDKETTVSYGFTTAGGMSKRFMNEKESFATVEELAQNIIDNADKNNA